jgi:hypothetical protein
MHHASCADTCRTAPNLKISIRGKDWPIGWHPTQGTVKARIIDVHRRSDHDSFGFISETDLLTKRVQGRSRYGIGIRRSCFDTIRNASLLARCSTITRKISLNNSFSWKNIKKELYTQKIDSVIRWAVFLALNSVRLFDPIVVT